MKKISWFLFALSAIAIGFYPALYFIIDREFGLLATKETAVLTDLLWNIGFYMHIVGGGVALLSGWSQFSTSLRVRRPVLHRRFGKVYVVAAVLSGMAGLFIGFYATGGLVTAAGFISLALVWLYTTISAYRSIRQGQLAAHERMMLYSYAACFGAVTLRIWLPLLILYFDDFTPAYRIVAWLSWVPNLLVVRLFLWPKKPAVISPAIP